MAISTTGDGAKRGERKRNRICPSLAIHTRRFAYASEDQRDDKEDNKEVTVHIPQVELQLLSNVRHSKFRWHARPPRSRKVLIILGSCVPLDFSLPALWERGRPRSSHGRTSPSACAYRCVQVAAAVAVHGRHSCWSRQLLRGAERTSLRHGHLSFSPNLLAHTRINAHHRRHVYRAVVPAEHGVA